MTYADKITYPMSAHTAFAVLYARHSIWQWKVNQAVGYDTLAFNRACRWGIVFG